MLKKILLALFLGVFSSCAYAMNEVPDVLAREDISVSSQTFRIHPGWLHENTQYHLHFFWTIGVKFEDCTLETQSTQVKIGGSPFSEKFQIYLQQFLKDPLVPNIHFVTDPLTFQTNPWLKDLQEKHLHKFFVSFIKDVEAQLIQDVEAHVRESVDFSENVLFHYKRMISTVFFSNAQSGNPAIASDFFRMMIGMHTQTCTEGPSIHHLSYSDIDTFVHGLETNADQFLRALFLSPDIKESSKLLRHAGANDVVSFEFKEENGRSDWNKRFCMKLLDYLCSPIARNTFDVCSYFPYQYKCIVSLSQETMEDVLKELHRRKSFSTNTIIYCTGPGLLDNFPEDVTASLRYPLISALTWNPLSPLREGVINLPLTTPELNLLFKAYFNLLDHTFVAKKLGQKHPSFLLLKHYIQEKNPFFSKIYKDSLKMYVTKEYETASQKKGEFKKQILNTWGKKDKKILRKYFYQLISNNVTENYYPTYFALKFVLKEYFNIEFELTKETLKDFLTRA